MAKLVEAQAATSWLWCYPLAAPLQDFYMPYERLPCRIAFELLRRSQGMPTFGNNMTCGAEPGAMESRRLHYYATQQMLSVSPSAIML